MSDELKERQSRFGELAMELMGADFARKFIQQVWDEASPAVKKDLADGILKRLTADAAKEGRMTGASVYTVLERVTKEAAASFQVTPKMVDELKERCQRAWIEYSQTIAKHVVQTCADRLLEQVKSAMYNIRL